MDYVAVGNEDINEQLRENGWFKTDLDVKPGLQLTGGLFLEISTAWHSIGYLSQYEYGILYLGPHPHLLFSLG